MYDLDELNNEYHEIFQESGFSKYQHWEHTTFIDTYRPHPPMENVSLSLLRIDSFNSSMVDQGVSKTSPQPPKTIPCYNGPLKHHLEYLSTYEHLSPSLCWIILHGTNLPWSYDFEHQQLHGGTENSGHNLETISTTFVVRDLTPFK